MITPREKGPAVDPCRRVSKAQSTHQKIPLVEGVNDSEHRVHQEPGRLGQSVRRVTLAEEGGTMAQMGRSEPRVMWWYIMSDDLVTLRNAFGRFILSTGLLTAGMVMLVGLGS